MGLARIRGVTVAVLGFGSVASFLPLGRQADLQRSDRASRRASVFAAVGSARGHKGRVIELRSATTGRVIEVLGPLGASWTNNGFTLAPDRRDVYFTLIPKVPSWDSLSLYQASVKTHKRRFIAAGEQPAVSPDSRLLGFTSGTSSSASIVIRDLASGRDRSINVSRLLGSPNDILNASLAWLGDGKQLAVLEACCPVAVSTSTARIDSPGSAGLHLVVVSVPRHGGLTARRVTLPAATEMPNVVRTDPTDPRSLSVSWLIAGDRAAVDRLVIGDVRATLTRVLTIDRSLVVGFDPTGRRVLYLRGHSQRDLWVAEIANDRLTDRHLLIRSSNLDSIAW